MALVDDEDYERINRHRWNARVDHRHGSGTVYAVRHTKAGGEVRAIFMHQQVAMSNPDIEVVDHRNRCGIDNQKENLRVCSNAQNAWNRAVNQTKRTSKYKGVYFDKSRAGVKPWQAGINCHKKAIRLGWFATENEAAQAYNDAALRYHGEYAYLNEIQDDNPPSEPTRIVCAEV